MSYKYSALAILYTAGIAYMSSVPKGALPGQSISGSGTLWAEVVSNLAHIPEFALLTFLWLKAYRKTGHTNRYPRVLTLILIFLVLFAISDELHQSFVPGRSASWMDMGLDLLGIIFGLAIYQKGRLRKSP